MRIRSILFASATVLAMSSPALAQLDGWYVEGAGGVNWAEDIEFSFTGPGTSGDLEFGTGWAARAAVGYGYGNGLRTEFEVSYRENNTDNPGDLFPVAFISGDGDVSALSLMINALYDIDIGSFVTPYVGVGIGASRVELESSLTDLTNGASGSWSGSDTGFAAQGIAGLSFAITEQLSATVDYRYFRVFDLDFTNSSFLPSPCCGASTLISEDDYTSHTVMAGLRYNFAAPPPPPPAPTIAPVAQTSFIIFFDWDSASLSPEANLVLDDVVVVANETGAASLMLDGYTDLSGSAAYNLGLSERRANAAADGLIARGIAPDEIVIRAFGEENPLVPTPDGVREPQNRRVEIIMS